ncbi:hypothetical protein ACA910_010390 [Epithemia clementina (nom. ined.)]
MTALASSPPSSSSSSSSSSLLLAPTQGTKVGTTAIITNETTAASFSVVPQLHHQRQQQQRRRLLRRKVAFPLLIGLLALSIRSYYWSVSSVWSPPSWQAERYFPVVIPGNHTNTTDNTGSSSSSSSSSTNKRSDRRENDNTTGRASSSLSLNFSTAFECRLALEKIQNQRIDEWKRLGVPAVEDVMEWNGLNYILLRSLPGDEDLVETLLTGEWYCGNESINSNSNQTIYYHQTMRTTVRGRNHPSDSSYYHRTQRLNWSKGLTVIPCPVYHQHNHKSSNGGGSYYKVTHLWPAISALPKIGRRRNLQSLSPPVYDLRHYQECQSLETLEFQQHRQRQKIRQQTKKAKEVAIQGLGDDSYVPLVGACLIVRGEKSRQALPEWIAYHSLIGIQHFWIHINEAWDKNASTAVVETLPMDIQDSVTFVPYNFYWPDHDRNSRTFLIHWQVPMQMRCLWQAKKLGLDWIITTDTDEFMDITDPNITHPTATIQSRHNNNKNHNIRTSNTSVITNDTSPQQKQHSPLTTLPPLLQFLKRFDLQEVGSIKMMNVAYGQRRYRYRKPQQYQLQMDQVWRHFNLTHGQYRPDPNYPGRYQEWSRCKHIYNVHTALSIGVHYLWSCQGACATNNGPNRRSPRRRRYAGLESEFHIHELHRPDQSLYLRHYRAGRTATGIHKIHNPRDLFKDSSLVDRYRNAVVAALNKNRTGGLIRHSNSNMMMVATRQRTSHTHSASTNRP